MRATYTRKRTEAMQKAVRQCLRMAGTEFYRRGIFKLPERWEKCVQRSGDYVEKERKVCRLRWCIWFVNNSACYFIKNCRSWLSVWPAYIRGVIDCNGWKTEKQHEYANMGKIKRLELWWQLYHTSLPVWDLENFRPMDFCWHECTCM